MIPDTDERLASVVRALTDVVLPSLPPEAGLAKEQVQLAIGHLQILRAQLDSILAFEAEELADAAALGGTLAAETNDADLRRTVDAAGLADGAAAVREARKAIHAAIDKTIASCSAAARPRVGAVILAAETGRAAKDRRWFAPFGFDAAPPAEA